MTVQQRAGAGWEAEPPNDALQTAVSHRATLIVLLAASILLAFGLRLVALGRDSLWYDETVSVYLAGQPAGELIAHTARDIHPPAYYLLLRGWLGMTGYPGGHADPTGARLEFVAGFLSLFFGVMLVPLTWQLARRLQLGQGTAALAAFLVALSPFGLWYSQEVRMYTVAAALSLLVLIGTASFLPNKAARSHLVRPATLYAVAAAAGLYTLYYFAFLLVSLNLFMLALLIGRALAGQTHRLDKPGNRQAENTPTRTLLWWMAAQVGVLALYLPWLPVAWRQATDPPVPPWRTTPQLGQALFESWSALSYGQAADPARMWPLLLVTLLLVAIAVACLARAGGSLQLNGATTPSSRRRESRLLALGLLLAAVFGPLALILLASTVTPLYHVRYLFPFSPAFSVLLAVGITAVASWHPPLGRWLSIGSTALLVAGSLVALRAYWTDAAFAADDHRAAVRELAQRWRPGDVVLVNAGYAYPALLTYWPSPVARQGRLSDYAPAAADESKAGQGPVILQTGHVDGDPELGWGDPRADFYALPGGLMRDKLRQVAANHARLWHYRIYDTVNDPEGSIREQLAQEWTPFEDRTYRGEANLRVQGFQANPLPAATGTWITNEYENGLVLGTPADSLPTLARTGAYLDVPGVMWSQLPELDSRGLAVSTRLVDDRGEVWAARDEPLGGNLATPQLQRLAQPLRLWIPQGTPPWSYLLDVVVYDTATGRPLQVSTGASAAGGQVQLGRVQVQRSQQTAAPGRSLADFGALRLLEAVSPASTVSPGDNVPTELVWQAAADHAAEALVVVVQLLDATGQPVASLEEEPLGGRYPTAQWQPGEVVRDRHTLPVPATTPPGRYRLIVGLYRAADGSRLEANAGLLGLGQQDFADVKKIEVR